MGDSVQKYKLIESGVGLAGVLHGRDKFIVESVKNIVDQDGRIPASDKAKVTSALVAQISHLKIEGAIKYIWEQTYSEQELTEMMAFFGGPIGTKIKMVDDKENEAISNIVLSEVKRSYQQVTQLPYQDPQPPKKAPPPDWLTQMIWKLYPPTRACPDR